MSYKAMSHVVRTIIKTAKAPAAIGPYSQAVQVGQTLYLSGSLGMDPASGALVSGGIEAEARQALKVFNYF
jgi:2-iminobutanoate/2-iminopropanoate deaminase